VLQPAPEDGRKLYERLKEKASKTYCIPASRRTTVAVETLRDWISLYKARGFDGLKPKPRKDIGSARAIPTEVLDLLVATKDTHRDYSVSMVIDAVKKESEAARAVELPLSTVHRVLSRAGVMEKLPEDGTTKDRRRFLLRARRRAVDERRHARAFGRRREPAQAEDVPAQSARRRDTRRPVLCLRAHREHGGVPTGPEERRDASRDPEAPLRR
jgi:hypothetical protein